MKNIIKDFVAVFAALSVVAACDGTAEVETPGLVLSSGSEAVEVSGDGSRAEVHIPSLGGSATLSVSTDASWDIVREDAEDWYDVAVEGDEITISAEELVSDYSRTALLRIRAGERMAGFIEISQDGTEVASLAVSPESVVFEETGGRTVVSVETNREVWTVTGYEDTGWLSVETADDSFVLTAEANSVAEDRTAILTVTAGSELNNKVCEIPVTILACTPAYVTPGQSELVMPADGGRTLIPVDSNREWECASASEWLTVAESSDGIEVVSSYVPAGTSGEIVLETVSGSDKAGMTISVKAVDNPMVIEYTVPAGGQLVAAPVSGAVNCYVDWGDAETSSCCRTLNMFEYMTHTYASAGVYKVRIYGSSEKISCDNGSEMESSKKCITALDTWGAIRPVSLYYGFSGTSIRTLPDDTAEALSEVTNFGLAFYLCDKLESVPADMLRNTRATDMAGMFLGCVSLREIPEGFLDGAVEVNNISTMFRDCRSLTAIPEGLFDSMDKVVMANSTFSGCSSVREIPAGLFDSFSATTQINGIFRDCSSLVTVPEGLFSSMTEVFDISEAFSGCTSLESVPADLFSGCNKIQYAISTFYGCSSLSCESPYDIVDGTKVHLYERGNHDSYSVINSYTSCFGGCTGLSDYSQIPQDWK